MVNKDKKRPSSIITDFTYVPVPQVIDKKPPLPTKGDWLNTALDAEGNIIDMNESETFTPYEIFNLLKDNKKRRQTLPTYIWEHVLTCVKFQNSCVTKTDDILSPHTRKVLSVKEAQEALQPLQKSRYDLTQWIPAAVLKHLGLSEPE